MNGQWYQTPNYCLLFIIPSSSVIRPLDSAVSPHPPGPNPFCKLTLVESLNQFYEINVEIY